MRRNYLTCLAVFLLLLSLPVLCFADYKVVIKKNGKILEGRLLSETDTAITIVSGGAHITFKKADLDLEKMKELNANYKSPSDSTTIAVTNEAAESTPQQQEASPLTDLAKQGTKTKGTDESKQLVDSNEKAFTNYIQDMEQQIKKGDITDDQQREILINLGTAKKGLSNYRARNTKKLTKSEQTVMLEELVKSLEFELDQNLKIEAPDAKITALKKEIAAKKNELLELQR